MPKRQSYRKGSSKKLQKKKFLIVVEGAVTEREYLHEIRRSLRANSLFIEIDNGNTDPIGIVNSAKELRKSALKSDPYDEIWCVFDVEANVTQLARHGLAEAIDSARRSRISLAISNPCFEIWLLWHKESKRGYTTSQFAQRRCQEIGITDIKGGKHILRLEELVKDNYLTAKNEATEMEHLHDRNQASTPESRNPSSGVYKLIDAISDAFSRT